MVLQHLTRWQVARRLTGQLSIEEQIAQVVVCAVMNTACFVKLSC